MSLTQTRSVRSRMPRSMRPPPEEARLDLEVGMGCANLVEEAVDRESLGVHRRAPPSGLLPASTRSRLWSHLT